MTVVEHVALDRFSGEDQTQRPGGGHPQMKHGFAYEKFAQGGAQYGQPVRTAGEGEDGGDLPGVVEPRRPAEAGELRKVTELGGEGDPIEVYVHDDRATYVVERIPGPGGLPLGSQDGALTLREFPAFVRAMARAGQSTAQTIEFFGAFEMAFSIADANSDGRVTPDELRSADDSYREDADR